VEEIVDKPDAPQRHHSSRLILSAVCHVKGGAFPCIRWLLSAQQRVIEWNDFKERETFLAWIDSTSCRLRISVSCAA
jgi:hypothetical protein